MPVESKVMRICMVAFGGVFGDGGNLDWRGVMNPSVRVFAMASLDQVSVMLSGKSLKYSD